MTTTRALLPDFSLANPLYATAEVTVYEADEDGIATATLATIYDGLTGAGTLSNPLDLDGDGKWQVPPYVDVPVIMSISGGSVADHSTGVAGPPSNFTGHVTFTDTPESAVGLVAFTGTVSGASSATVRGAYYKVGRHVTWMANIRMFVFPGSGDEVYLQTSGLPTPDFPSTSGVGTPLWSAEVVRISGPTTGIAAKTLSGSLNAAGEVHFTVGSQEATTAKLTDANSTTGIGAIDLLVAGTYVSGA